MTPDDYNRLSAIYRPGTATVARTVEEKAIMLLYGRLRLQEGERFPLPHLSLYITSEKAVVFLIDKNDSPLIIEDDPALFPSDALVTQIRLLIA